MYRELSSDLYDFVVRNALLFYSAGEQAGSKAQDSFVLSAESLVFASAKVLWLGKSIRKR